MSERRELNTQRVDELKESGQSIIHETKDYSKDDIIAARNAFRQAAKYRGFEVKCIAINKDDLMIIRK